MKGKKVFVTGGDGFIGSHLVEQLVHQGAEVRALVYYNSFDSWGWLDALPKDVADSIEVVLGDIRDSQHMELLTRGMEVVFHLAALIGIPYSYVAPDQYIQTNVTGTLNILNAVKKCENTTLIHTSTSEVYGSAQFVPMTETHPIRPQSPYAASKAAADLLALSYHTSFQLPVTVVRPFNTFGPRQSTRAIIPTLLTQFSEKSATVRVGALHPTRDFTYVRDTAAGFIAAASTTQGIGEVVQLGSNFEISVSEIIELLSEITGHTPRIEVEQERMRPEASEVQRLYADNSRAQQLLGWKPEFTGREGFKRALAKTSEWFTDSANRKLYRTARYTI